MKAYSIDLRHRIVQAYQRGEGSIRAIAVRFQVAPSFVQKLLKQLQETGSLEPKGHGGGNPGKIKETEEQVLRELLAQKNDRTLAELCQELEHRQQVKVTEMTLSRVLRRLGFTRKKKAVEAKEKNQERVRYERYLYWQKIGQVAASQLVFVDEAGVHLGLNRVYGWAEQGSRAYGETPLNRGRNISLLGGLSLDGMLALTPIQGPVNALIFEAFIAQRLLPRLLPGQIVVMDNASIHRKEALEEILTPAQVGLQFLPPYSPDLSPIENSWSKLKNCLRGLAAETLEGLQSAIAQAWGTLSFEDIHNWFTHCCYCTEDFDFKQLRPHPIVLR